MTTQHWVKEDHRAPLVICLIGPIEYWWNRPDDPKRFMSHEAQTYRQGRDQLSLTLEQRGYLVYRPHEAFKGGWDERAQAINNYAVQVCDVVVHMTPHNVPIGRGTNDELDLAVKLGTPVLHFDVTQPRWNWLLDTLDNLAKQ